MHNSYRRATSKALYPPPYQQADVETPEILEKKDINNPITKTRENRDNIKTGFEHRRGQPIPVRIRGLTEKGT